jgi:hypothetical protein
MKKLLSYLLVTALLVVFTHCSDDDDDKETPYTCASCVTAPEALAANDNIAKGVYKGIVVGSSGTIKISIENGNSTSTATLTIDGKTATLTTSTAVVAEQPFEADFTGMFNGQEATIGFYVEADGTFAYISSTNIPGHPEAEIGIVKETSTDLIESFEGTYAGSSSGTFNFVISKAQHLWGAVSSEDYFDGTLSGNTITGINYDEDVNVSGTLSNHTASGSWEKDGGDKGTWQAKRTQ